MRLVPGEQSQPKQHGGQTARTFNELTRPTDVEAQEFITGSVGEVTSSCPALPESRWGLGKEAVRTPAANAVRGIASSCVAVEGRAGRVLACPDGSKTAL